MKIFIDFIFNMEGASSIFIGFVTTILGAIVGYFLSRKISREAIEASNTNAINIMRRQEFNNASARLRDAFRDELLALNPALQVLRDIPALLEESFNKHRAAILDFSHFLAPETKSAFYDAWYTYYCPPKARNENSIHFFEQYSSRGKNVEQVHEIKSLARSRIEAILEFTNIENITQPGA